MGTLNRPEQKKWFADARMVIDTAFNEIKGCILFNSAFDDNVVPGVTADLKKLDWTIQNNVTNAAGATHERDMNKSLQMLWEAKQTRQPDPSFLRSLHGMNFSKGKNWFKNFLFENNFRLRAEPEENLSSQLANPTQPNNLES